MKRIKKIVAIAAASMLLCGFTGQAAEGNAEAAAPQGHTHKYTKLVETTCIASNTQYQHTYLIESTGEYSTCYVVLFAYRDVYQCNICNELGEIIRTKPRHMNCGQ